MHAVTSPVLEMSAIWSNDADDVEDMSFLCSGLPATSD